MNKKQLTRRFLGGIFLSNALLSCPYQSIPTSLPSSSSALQKTLQELNQQFLETHKIAGKYALKSIEAIIIYKGSELSLWKQENSVWKSMEMVQLAQQEPYVTSKVMNHIPLMITMAIDLLMAHPECREKIIDMLSCTHRNLIEVKNNVDMDQVVQQHALQRSIELIAYIMHQPMTPEKWNEIKIDYIQSLASERENNNRIAVRINLTDLDQVIRKWEMIYHIEVEKTRVITVVPHGAKEKHIETTYLLKWMQKRLNGSGHIENQLLYKKECSPEEMNNLDCKKDIIETFLAGAEINKKIGLDYLKNAEGMFEDLLHPYADAVIQSRLMVSPQTPKPI